MRVSVKIAILAYHQSAMDMAIGLVIFNPARTKRIIMNYLYTVNEFHRHRLPVFTLELCFGNSKPEISDSIVVRGNSHMFHKERLCRLLETKIPSVYSKVAFIDADILFDSPDWYQRTSKLLNEYDVVHPFERCNWLDLKYKTVFRSQESVVKINGTYFDASYHPGFAWAFRRDWYRSVGFYDHAVSGSGDALSAATWLNKEFPPGFKSLPVALRPSYDEFEKRPRPRITYLKACTVSHLYHGTIHNRQYTNRHAILDIPKDIRSLLYENPDGVYECSSPLDWNPILLDYFKNRNDDDLGV